LHRSAAYRPSVTIPTPIRNTLVSASERKRELSRRRSRKDKLTKLKSKLPKATQSEKTEIARKLRELTPGAEALIADWKLVESDR
jgi:uncharacterized protein with von Willebrand factor type A (vWA) domain